MHGLAIALLVAAVLAQLEGKPAQAERLASEVIELSTRQNFAQWRAAGEILRGWARSVLGNTTEGIAWIEDGLRDYLSSGTLLGAAYYLSLKAQALYLANRTPEALEAIKEADALVEKNEGYIMRCGLHGLRGVCLTAMGAEEAQIEASFQEAIRIAKEQKKISSEKWTEAIYAEYRRQIASGSAGRGCRLPL